MKPARKILLAMLSCSGLFTLSLQAATQNSLQTTTNSSATQQSGTMQLNLQMLDQGGTDTVTDTYTLKHIKASEIEPFIKTRLSRYGAVQVNDALNMVIITDLENKVRDLLAISKKLDSAELKDFIRLETEIVTVANIQASSISGLIQEKLSSDAVVKVDNNLNTLVITDVRSKIDQVLELIKKLDVPVRQVLIEAKIVELNYDDDSSTGLDWQGILKSAQGVANMTAGKVDAKFSTLAEGQAFAENDGAVVKFQNQALRGGFNIQGLDTLLGVLVKDGRATILSSPRIVGSNNRPAYINTGERIYYTYSNTNSSTNQRDSTNSRVEQRDYDPPALNDYRYKYISADSNQDSNTYMSENNSSITTGITLNVVPHIVSDELVTLDINANISELISWSPQGQPVTSNRTANSTVTIKSGEVFVMGGLKKEVTIKERRGIPYLRAIPGLGFFFGRTVEKKVSQDVVIFVNPTILQDVGKNLSQAEKKKLEKAEAVKK